MFVFFLNGCELQEQNTYGGSSSRDPGQLVDAGMLKREGSTKEHSLS